MGTTIRSIETETLLDGTHNIKIVADNFVFNTEESGNNIFFFKIGAMYSLENKQTELSTELSFPINIPSGTYGVSVRNNNISTNENSDTFTFTYTAPTPTISTINFTQLEDGRGTIDISGMYFSTEEDGNTIVFANSDEPVPYAELFIQAQSTTELSFTSDIFMPSGTYSSVTVRNNITNMISVPNTSFDYIFQS